MDKARYVLDKVRGAGRPYAVFVRGDELELMPADGKRFAKLQREPWRGALCVGVYDREATLERIAADLSRAGIHPSPEAPDA